MWSAQIEATESSQGHCLLNLLNKFQLPVDEHSIVGAGLDSLRDLLTHLSGSRVKKKYGVSVKIRTIKMQYCRPDKNFFCPVLDAHYGA